LCLILVGLTELRRRLAMAVHESLTQRIPVRYPLQRIEPPAISRARFKKSSAPCASSRPC
jgi:type II secretory pathway predicted ATPase ExeA